MIGSLEHCGDIGNNLIWMGPKNIFNSADNLLHGDLFQECKIAIGETEE